MCIFVCVWLFLKLKCGFEITSFLKLAYYILIILNNLFYLNIWFWYLCFSDILTISNAIIVFLRERCWSYVNDILGCNDFILLLSLLVQE